MIIKSHRELARAIAGKTILLANSLGKDSAVCLHWLTHYAKPGKVYSVFFERFTVHPDELRYHEYQKARYQGVTFLTLPDPNEISMIAQGIFQNPERQELLDSFEHDAFYREGVLGELMEQLHIDYVCDGTAGYEGMGRAQKFHGKGLLIDDTIYPIGLMKKAEIVEIIRSCKIKLNPTYKYYSSTFDEIAYFRMRSAMLANPEYTALLFRYFPTFRADVFRHEVVNAEIAKETKSRAKA